VEEDARALSPAESDWQAARARWGQTEGGYSHIQGTRAQTLAYGLADSPAALAAWIVEKSCAWSDCEGDVLRRFSMDELLTNLSVYWFSGNVAATLRIYKENAASPLRFGRGERVLPPLSFALFPKGMHPPREWVERAFTVNRWTHMPRGGHFAAMEEPMLLARDTCESFAAFR